jgi:hypothetical protein
VSQRQYLDDFWYRSDLKIDGDPQHPSRVSRQN